MKWFRKLVGLDFPDPEAGQVWRSGHSGRAFRVKSVELSDCGSLWLLSLQSEVREGEFLPLANQLFMDSCQWREMLKDECRVLERQWPEPPPIPHFKPPRHAEPCRARFDNTLNFGGDPNSSTAQMRERATMEEEITISKADLVEALKRWEMDARTGKTMTREEAAALSLDACAEAGADTLWGLLAVQVPA